MHVTRTDISENQIKLSIVAGEAVLMPYKKATLEKLAEQVKVPGFRKGKIPLNLVEKHADPQLMQTEFLDEALRSLYAQAINEEKLRPIDSPKISLKKFVPYTVVEFDADVEVLGKIKLASYRNIKKTKPKVTVSATDIDKVIKSLQQRIAKAVDVKRAAKSGDKVTINFKGTDSKKKPIQGADGTNYPLVLGSDSFIPGFEKNLLGLKTGEKKVFTLTFPKNYGVNTLAGSKVTFEVDIVNVQEQELPVINDDFATQAGPFKTIDELKKSIKTELTHEKEKQAEIELEGEIVKEIAEKSTLSVPKTLIDEQINRLMSELRQNLTYGGLTFEEFLKRENKTEDEYREKVVIPEATQRVRAGLVLAEIAEQEQIEVTPNEVEERLSLLKTQYKDEAMQAELEKPESKQNIASRMLTEKTIQKLVHYATG